MNQVAPRTGAWIETWEFAEEARQLGRPPHGGVD